MLTMVRFLLLKQCNSFWIEKTNLYEAIPKVLIWFTGKYSLPRIYVLMLSMRFKEGIVIMNLPPRFNISHISLTIGITVGVCSRAKLQIILSIDSILNGK